MRAVLRNGIVVIAVIGASALVAAGSSRDFLTSGEPLGEGDVAASGYETTGSVEAASANRAILALTDEQRERIYQGVMRFPDAVRRDARTPELADRLPREEPVQDLPASVTEEISRLYAYKFVKLDDRILVIDPTTRVIAAMIPRYKLLR
jgi:hypothetical protein